MITKTTNTTMTMDSGCQGVIIMGSRWTHKTITTDTPQKHHHHDRNTNSGGNFQMVMESFSRSSPSIVRRPEWRIEKKIRGVNFEIHGGGQRDSRHDICQSGINRFFRTEKRHGENVKGSKVDPTNFHHEWFPFLPHQETRTIQNNFFI